MNVAVLQRISVRQEPHTTFPDGPGTVEEVIGVATRLDPFRDLERLFNQSASGGRSASVLAMDLYRAGDHYVIRVDLPAADPGSIDVSLDDRMLTIRGQRTSPDEAGVQWLVQERPAGSFARQIALGPGVSVDGISATYTDGVLIVTVPVAQEAKPRRIEVTRSEPDSSALGGAEDRQSIDAN